MDTESDDKDDRKTNWLQIKRHRNRVNSQRTRNRERDQLESLTHRKTCLYLSNTAMQYQNHHMREAIRKIQEHLNRRKRTSGSGSAIPAVPTNPSIGTGPTFFSHQQSIPTNPSIIPSPQVSNLHQQQQIIHQMLTQAVLPLHQHTTSSLPPPPPPVGNANQVLSMIQTELARNPILATAMNAGMLQLMAPNNLTHASSRQLAPPPAIPLHHQVAAAIPSFQQAIAAELSRNNQNIMPVQQQQQPMIPAGQNQESNISSSTTLLARSTDAARDTMDQGENKETTT